MADTLRTEAIGAPVEHYQAPRPQLSGRRVLALALRWQNSPLAIIWDLLKLRISSSIGSYIGRQILPAQLFSNESIPKNNEELRNKISRMLGRRYLEQLMSNNNAEWKSVTHIFQLPEKPTLIQDGGHKFYPYILSDKQLTKLQRDENVDSSTHAYYLTEETKTALENRMGQEQFKSEGLLVKSVDVYTHDNCKLDTSEISHISQAGLPEADKKYIINFYGNGDLYQQGITDIAHTVIAMKTTIIGFNYRGVGHSSGQPNCKDDLIIDGIAQVQRLLDKGVKPSNIYLNGRSLGGAVATLVARHFNNLGIEINLFNDRSYSTLTRVVMGWIRSIGSGKSDGRSESIVGIILSYILWPLVKGVLILSRWEMDAAKAFKQLPTERKFYTLVRSKPLKEACVDAKNSSNREIIYDDEIIPHFASLHRGLGKQSAKTGFVKFVGIASPIDSPPHSPHNELLVSLQDREGKSGAAYFGKFFRERSITATATAQVIAEPNETPSSTITV